ncbi:MAG TPA: hypothetical protein VEC11_14955 [Allosphingosinicella sp.]|nr:hypothetical protein [Allosphingosinicella sp.]
MEENASQVTRERKALTQPTGEGQSRRKQTWILAVAIVVAGLMAAFVPGILEQKRAYDRIYPGCWQLIGRDQHCEMTVNTDAFIRGR